MLGFFLIQNIPGDKFKLQIAHAKVAPDSTFTGTFKSCIGSYCRATGEARIAFAISSTRPICTIVELDTLDLGCHFVLPSAPLCSTLIYYALTTLNTLISTHIPLPWLLDTDALIANSCMVQNRSMLRSATNQLICACCTTLAKQFNNELAQSQKGAGSGRG